MFDFSEKVVLITGASSGIGKALANALLAKGALVAVCGRNMDSLITAFKNAPQERLLLVKADVSKDEDCMTFVQAATAKWGRVDVLVNNAGISMRALFEKADLKVIRELMDINFWGTVQCSKYALPEIRKNKGIIVGISSIAGYRGATCANRVQCIKICHAGLPGSIADGAIAYRRPCDVGQPWVHGIEYPEHRAQAGTERHSLKPRSMKAGL